MMHILFLCTGNSCRSQVAEGWTRALDDPARVTGSEDEVLRVFRLTRDAIRQRVQCLLTRLREGSSA